MLDQAVAIGTKRPVEWRQADAMQLPFEDGAFDAVVCQFGVMFFPDKAKAFAEARRVLRAGGLLMFSVWDRIEENEFADTVTAALASLFPTTRLASSLAPRTATTIGRPSSGISRLAGSPPSPGSPPLQSAAGRPPPRSRRSPFATEHRSETRSRRALAGGSPKQPTGRRTPSRGGSGRERSRARFRRTSSPSKSESRWKSSTSSPGTTSTPSSGGRSSCRPGGAAPGVTPTSPGPWRSCCSPSCPPSAPTAS